MKNFYHDVILDLMLISPTVHIMQLISAILIAWKKLYDTG